MGQAPKYINSDPGRRTKHTFHRTPSGISVTGFDTPPGMYGCDDVAPGGRCRGIWTDIEKAFNSHEIAAIEEFCLAPRGRQAGKKGLTSSLNCRHEKSARPGGFLAP